MSNGRRVYLGIGFALALVVGLLFSCAAFQPVSVREVSPTQGGVLFVVAIPAQPQYAQWYADVEACLGMTGDFASVRWFASTVPWKDGLHGDGLTYGMYWGRHRIIVNAMEAHDSTLVSHEMVHEILDVHNIQPEVAHPAPYFGPTGCAAVYRP